MEGGKIATVGGGDGWKQFEWEVDLVNKTCGQQ